MATIDDPTRVARHLIESAASLAHTVGARAIIAAVDALPPVDAVPPRTILIVRDEHDQQRVDAMVERPQHVLAVPPAELDRLGQVKLAAIIALSNRTIGLGDSVIFLSGAYRSLIDTLVVMRIGSEYELLDSTDQPQIDEHIRRAVFHRMLSLALELGQHGRESRRVGCVFVIGDHENVREQSEQMILNPFKGYEPSERNVLDDAMRETIKEYASLDGAFIIRGNGVVETAGARLKTSLSVGLPSGLGARHAAAAGITSVTRSIAITVSESDGTVRVWRAGRMVAALEPTRRG